MLNFVSGELYRGKRGDGNGDSPADSPAHLGSLLEASSGAGDRRGGQPVADCLCFWVFRTIDALSEGRGATKRGGAGASSESGWASGNRAVGGSTSVRTTSAVAMGDDCRVL